MLSFEAATRNERSPRRWHPRRHRRDDAGHAADRGGSATEDGGERAGGGEDGDDTVFVATRAQAVDTPAALRHVFRVGDLNVPFLQLLEMAVTVLALVGLAALLRRTTLGLSMRAAAKDFDTVQLMGVNANRVIVTAFALAGFFAGLAAIFIIVRRGAVDAFMGVGPVIKAFVAVVLGGMGSLSAAVAGGLVLGGLGVQSLSAAADDEERADALEAEAERLDAIIFANQDAQREGGHYGVPLMVFDGEPFFGQDRFDQLKWRMEQKGLSKR